MEKIRLIKISEIASRRGYKMLVQPSTPRFVLDNETAVDILIDEEVRRLSLTSYNEAAYNSETDEDFLWYLGEMKECKELTAAIRYYYDGGRIIYGLPVYSLPGLCITNQEVCVSDDDFILATSHDQESMNLWRESEKVSGANVTFGYITERLREFGYKIGDKVSRVTIDDKNFFDVA